VYKFVSSIRMLNVAISVDSAVDYGPQAVRVIAAACEEVIGERRCPVATDLAPGAVTAWYAVVHPRDAALTGVRIEFRDRTADGVLIEQRDLAFSPRDTQDSRLASVGSVIAALAAAREGPVVRAPEATRSAPPPAPVEERPAWAIDLAGLVAPDVDGGPSRVGGFARAEGALGARPLALASVRAAMSSGNPSYSWLALGAGAGARLGDRSARLGVEVSGEAVFERTGVSVSRGGVHDSTGQNGWGGRLGIDAVWAASRRWAAMLGADATMVLPRINVVVAEGSPTRLAFVTVGIWAGVRFSP
jgi:hypothetical protein